MGYASLRPVFSVRCYVFFFIDTATTEIYTLSLHDALPISGDRRSSWWVRPPACRSAEWRSRSRCGGSWRSEEHTSELQSHVNLVCRLLLEKKKRNVANENSASDSLVLHIHT